MTIRLITAAEDGTPGNGDSFLLDRTSDGRYVVFESDATNLVAGDTNDRRDIFVKDLQTGALTRVNTSADGVQADKGAISATISDDGRFVAFRSFSTNLVPGDTDGREDLFVKDLQTGAIRQVDGFEDFRVPDNFELASGGDSLVFSSSDSSLIPGDTNNADDGFVKNLQTGMITRITTAADGTQGNDGSFAPSLSADGRLVVFTSLASNLVPGDSGSTFDIFLKDLQTGAITRVNTTAEGRRVGDDSFRPSLSSDEQSVLFISLNPFDGEDIYVKNLQMGTLTLVNTDADGTQATGSTDADGFTSASISADGRFVAFSSNASGLVPGDTNETWDTFVKDLQTGAIARVNTAVDGSQSNASALSPLISGDGSTVVFDGGGSLTGQNIFELQVYLAEVTPSAPPIAGTAGDDSLAGGPRADTIFGFAGDDTISGRDASDILEGGFGSNLVAGGRGDDTLSAIGDGDDTMNGDDGADLLIGGDGDDVLNLGSGDDSAGSAGGDGDDTIKGGTGDDGLSGNDGDDFLSGGDGNDSIDADLGNDTINTGSGDDRMSAGSGNDVVSCGAGRDFVFGEAGLDTLDGGDGDDTIVSGGGDDLVSAGSGDDLALGETGADTLDGGSGDDTINGGIREDTLFGGDGADVLVGSVGQDTLRGGGAADVYLFLGLSDSLPNARDAIAGFHGAGVLAIDVIDLSALDADAARLGDQAFTFLGEAAAFTAPGQIRLVDIGDRTLLLANVDADPRTAEFAISILDGSAATAADYTAADFIL